MYILLLVCGFFHSNTGEKHSEKSWCVALVGVPVPFAGSTGTVDTLDTENEWRVCIIEAVEHSSCHVWNWDTTRLKGANSNLETSLHVHVVISPSVEMNPSLLHTRANTQSLYTDLSKITPSPAGILGTKVELLENLEHCQGKPEQAVYYGFMHMNKLSFMLKWWAESLTFMSATYACPLPEAISTQRVQFGWFASSLPLMVWSVATVTKQEVTCRACLNCVSTTVVNAALWQ